MADTDRTAPDPDGSGPGYVRSSGHGQGQNHPAEAGEVRMTVGPQVVAVVLIGIAVGLAAFNVADAAHRILGWAVASAVVAALLDPLVRRFSRYLPRVVAILLGLLIVAVLAGSVVTGILADLDNQFNRLQDEGPRAAAELESSDRFGSLARNFRLEDRVDEVLTRLRDPTSGVASEETASTASAYLVAAVLTAFLLSSGPGAAQMALQQIRDPDRRETVREVVGLGFSHSRAYVLFALVRAGVAGSVTWGLCWWEDVPAPIVLGVAVAGLSIVPGFGIFFAGVFALLLEAGLGTTNGVVRLAIAFLILQIADVAFSHQVVEPRTLSVGPAPIVVAVIVGFEVYGVGGAVYAATLAIFGVAMLDAAGQITQPGNSDGKAESLAG